MRGGYQIIDLKENNLTRGVPVAVPGVYDSIEGNHFKPLLLSGIVIEGKEHVSFFHVPVVDSNSAYLFAIGSSGDTIKIASDDTVTLQNIM